jgi:iron complex outermembrane receptor protein
VIQARRAAVAPTNPPPAVAIGAFLNAPALELPQTRETVTRQEIEERGQRTFYETLAGVPGVTAGEGPTPMSRTAGQLSVRGFGGTDPMLNNFVMPRIMSLYLDSILIERADFFKGASGSIGSTRASSLGAYGSGGAVNLTTPVPELRERILTSLEGAYTEGGGSSYRATGVLNEPFGGIGAARVGVAADVSAPFWLRNECLPGERYTVAPSVLLGTTPDAQLHLDLFYAHVDQPGYQGVASTTNGIGRWYDKYYGTKETRDVAEIMGVQLRGERALSEEWTVRGGASWLRSVTDSARWILDQSAGSATVVNWGKTGIGKASYSDSQSINDNFGGYAQVENRHDFSWFRNDLVLGMDGFYRVSGSRSYAGKPVNVDLDHPDLPLSQPKATGRYLYDTLRQVSVSAYDAVEVGPVRVEGGARADFVHYNDLGLNDRVVSPRACVTYQVLEPLRAYFSYDENRGPNFWYSDASGNPLSGTWVTKSYETGLKYEPLNHLLLGAALFRMDQEDVAIADPASPNPMNPYYYLGGDNTARGAELSVNGDITANWSCRAAYTFTLYENNQNTNHWQNMPRNMVSLWQTYTLREGPLAGVRFGLGYRYVAERNASAGRGLPAGRQFRLAGYSVFDALVAYDLQRLFPEWHGTIQARVDNLLNEAYVVGQRSITQNFPGQPRTVSLRLTTEF